jgi:hypothetical protein
MSLPLAGYSETPHFERMTYFLPDLVSSYEPNFFNFLISLITA